MCFGFNFNIKNYSTFIGSLICLVGCAYQIYDITNDYLSNETITKRLLNPATDLPGLTICASKTYTTFNQTRILDEKGNVNLDLINDLKIDEQFNNSYRYHDIISECKIPTANNSFADCSEVYTIKEYLTLEEECIIFFNQTNNNHAYKIDFRENRPLNLKINKKVIKKRITFTVHSENTTFDHFNHNFIKLSTHRYSKNSISYSNINIESLPAPYKTECTDYTYQSFKTKGNCVRECLIKSYNNIFNKWPPNVPVRHSKLEFATYQTDQQNDKQSNKTKKTQRTLCEEECNLGTPCYQQMFEPLVISETEQLIRRTETFQLFIIPPPYVIHFQYEIKTPMIHFLCYIASTVNLWLGISAYPLLKSLINMKGINLNKHKKKESESNNNSSHKYDLNNYQSNVSNNMPNNVSFAEDEKNVSKMNNFGFSTILNFDPSDL